MQKYKLTLTGIAIAVAGLLVTIISGFDLFEYTIGFLAALEQYEIDEFIIPFIIVLIFALFEQTKLRKSQAIEIEKAKIYKAMLASSHHILNNLLNHLQLFQVTALETPGFDSDVLSLYDGIIQEATAQIEALGSITNIDEVTIHESVVP